MCLSLTAATGINPRPLCLTPTSWMRELFFGSTLSEKPIKFYPNFNLAPAGVFANQRPKSNPNRRRFLQTVLFFLFQQTRFKRFPPLAPRWQSLLLGCTSCCCRRRCCCCGQRLRGSASFCASCDCGSCSPLHLTETTSIHAPAESLLKWGMCPLVEVWSYCRMARQSKSSKS